MTQWVVEVIEKATGNVVRTLGPHESKKADRIADGVRVNLDRKKYYVTQKPHEEQANVDGSVLRTKRKG